MQVLVFDIDDTLYLERDYVRSGFGAAGRWARSPSSASPIWLTGRGRPSRKACEEWSSTSP